MQLPGHLVKVVAVLVLVSSTLAWSQPAPTTTTIHVLSDLIEVPALAFRPPLRPTATLSRNDFAIHLDGGPAFVPEHARIQGSEPLTLVMVVEADPKNASVVSQALRSAIDHWTPDILRASDRLSIYVSGCRLVRSLHEQPADLPLRRAQFVDAFSFANFDAAMQADNKCHPLATNKVIDVAINQMENTTQWKIVLLIANGEHGADYQAMQRVQDLAAAQGVTIFAVKYLRDGHFTPLANVGNDGLNRLVSSLGGVTVESSFAGLGTATATVIGLLRQRYILSFPPPASRSAGAHWLQITSRVKGIQVLSSAASAPLIDSAHCGPGNDTWLCTQRRPQYGAENPQQGRPAPRELPQIHSDSLALQPATTRASAGDASAHATVPAVGKGVAVEHFGAARNLPLVILLHGVGGPSDFYREQAEFFAHQGYRVELPHYMDAGHGQAGTNENYAAWVGAVRQVMDGSEQSHPPAVFIVGYSLGASVALAIGSQGKGPDAIVEFYGSLPDPYYHSLAGMPPLLVLHGERDTNIPVINAQQLLQLCVQSNFACESHLYPDEGHGFRPQAQHDAEQRTLRFLSQIQQTHLQ